MTHLSSFRYNPSVLDRPEEGGRSSEVRVRYFDPATGEPRGEKPEPLARRAEKEPGPHERDERRRAAEAEAAEIAEAMRRRRRAAGGGGSRTGGAVGGRKRPVLVDGALFESVAAAAAEVGTTPQNLGRALLDGRGSVKGRAVRFAEAAGGGGAR